jgi:hypothetical protein
MASPRAYRIKVEQCDRGTLASSATNIKLGVVVNENQPIDTVVPMSTAQFQGLKNYLANIRAGTNTAAVETAITNLGI